MELIDREELLKDLKTSAIYHANNSREETLMYRDRNIVREQPTVEAIPRADYENRLKADMVAILTELHLKMEELGDDLYPTEDWDYGYKSGVEDMIQLLDERIDKLKGESDAQEQKKE